MKPQKKTILRGKPAVRKFESPVSILAALYGGNAMKSECAFCAGEHWSDECEKYETTRTDEAGPRFSIFIIDV